MGKTVYSRSTVHCCTVIDGRHTGRIQVYSQLEQAKSVSAVVQCASTVLDTPLVVSVVPERTMCVSSRA